MGPAAVNDLLAALRRRDREAVRRALHPYVHWRCEDGTTLRGRNNVMATLLQAPVPEPPSSAELRDGQIYRWVT